jgi:predicted DNA binding protein
MIKNIILFLGLALIASASQGCSSGGGAARSEAETTALQKYVRQVLPKLDALEASHKDMMRQIGDSLRPGADKGYRYDEDKVAGQISRMRAELDNMQKDFREMTIPKSGESFAGNIMQLIQNERIYLDKVESRFKSESHEISEGAWSELTANAALTPYQKSLLAGAMTKVAGLTQNANAGGR